jgi:hypothetical protein
MLYFDVGHYNKSFLDNLLDWSLGGPKKGGWTRTGDKIPVPDGLKLVSATRTSISVDDAMAKNMTEVMKWHVGFLLSDSDLEETLYYKEYLWPRHEPRACKWVADSFRSIHEYMKNYGYNYKYPIFVADVKHLDLGMDYFRFDGCHRLASAKVIGMDMVPAYVFRIEADH